MKRYLPIVGIVFGLSLAIYALFLSDSDEDKIRALFHRLEDAIAVTPDDTNIVVRAAHIKGEFAEIFDKDVSFQIPELSGMTAGRAELAGLAAKAPQMWRTANANLDGLAITVADEGMSAVAVGEAVLDATRQDGTPDRDTRSVTVSLDKIEGQWRIVDLTVSAKDDS